MTEPQLQALLDRCDSGVATEAELERMRRVLHEQDTAGGWWGGLGSALAEALSQESGESDMTSALTSAATPEVDGWAQISATLRASSGDAGRVELSNTVMRDVAPEESATRDSIVVAFRQGLEREAGGFEVVEDVLQHVMPQPCPLQGAIQALRFGLGHASARLDISSVVLSAVAPHSSRAWDMTMAVMRQGLIETASVVDITRPVMDHVLGLRPALEPEIESASDLDAAFGTLAAGIFSEMGDLDIASSVMQAIGVEPSPVEAPELVPEMQALTWGLDLEARQVDVVGPVMSAIQWGSQAAMERPLETALDALAAGLAAEAVGLDVVETVMDAVAPEASPVLEHALSALVAGLEAEAVGLDLAADVMSSVMDAAISQQEQDPGVVLSAMVDGELAPDARRAVATRLGRDLQARRVMSAWAELGWNLRRALHNEVVTQPISSVWPAVARSLDLAESGAQVAWRETVEAMEQGLAVEMEAIDVVDAVMERVLPPVVVREPEPLVQAPEHQDTAVPAWSRRMQFVSFAFGMAAVVLVATLIRPPADSPAKEERPPLDVAFQLADENIVEIEDLTVAKNAMVQVFQFEEGAPMVIFIDEGIDSDGATL